MKAHYTLDEEEYDRVADLVMAIDTEIGSLINGMDEIKDRDKIRLLGKYVNSLGKQLGIWE